MTDKHEQERQALTRQVLHLERLEDDYRALKTRYEQEVLTFQATFQGLHREVLDLLSAGASQEVDVAQDWQEESVLAQDVTRYTDQELGELDEASRRLGRKWEEEREALLTERNKLSWD